MGLLKKYLTLEMRLTDIRRFFLYKRSLADDNIRI